MINCSCDATVTSINIAIATPYWVEWVTLTVFLLRVPAYSVISISRGISIVFKLAMSSDKMIDITADETV